MKHNPYVDILVRPVPYTARTTSKQSIRNLQCVYDGHGGELGVEGILSKKVIRTPYPVKLYRFLKQRIIN